MYNAIHVIQEKLDVTGTTAREASTTFSGSFGAMKSAVKNLLGFMASGGDGLRSGVEQLVPVLECSWVGWAGSKCTSWSRENRFYGGCSED